MNDTQHRNPFKFLDSYTREDRDLFFGRDDEIAQLYRIFYARRLTVIYGESGAGKTSLIQCGLQTKISEGDALFIPIRFASDPLKSLKKELLKQLEEIPDSDDLNHLLKELWYQESLTLVLVLDQFEEFFLFHSRTERERIIEQITAWTQCKYIRVIISIREDYYARLTELEKQLPEVFDNRFWVLPMTRDQARDAIVKPCQLYHIEIEDKLVEKLLDDLLAGNKEIDLPILQVVLDRLYHQATKEGAEQLTFSLEAYSTLGEIDKILASFIGSRLQRYNNAKTIRYVLKTMITEQGTRKIRKLEQIKQKLPDSLDIDETELETIMQRLSGDRLIRDNVGEGAYELRHDSLAKAFLAWELEKNSGRYDFLLNEALSNEAFVRHGLILLESDIREIVLITLQEWQKLGIVLPEIIDSVKISSLSMKNWEDLRDFLRTLLNSHSAIGIAAKKIQNSSFTKMLKELRENSSFTWSDYLIFYDVSPAEMDIIFGSKYYALEYYQLDKPRLGFTSIFPFIINLSADVVDVDSTDDEFWKEANRILRGFLIWWAKKSKLFNYCQAIEHKSPWFITIEGSLVSYNGFKKDSNIAYYSTREGKLYETSEYTSELIIAFQKLTGKSQQEVFNLFGFQEEKESVDADIVTAKQHLQQAIDVLQQLKQNNSLNSKDEQILKDLKQYLHTK